MSRISSVFVQPSRKALIAYVTVGYPSVRSTLEVVALLAECGCDMVELGIPFSDPLADGTTIQRASFAALHNGVTPELCLDIARLLRHKVSVPLVFMTYFNPVFNYGLEKFCVACASSGVDGLIIPDLPPEEGSELEVVTQRYGIDLVYLLAPTSSQERVSLVAERSRGFIYLVSVTGVTGARDELPPHLGEFVSRVKKIASQPVCVGFGISTPEQARQVAKLADGVIIGSRLIQLMEAEVNSAAQLRSFTVEVRNALDQSRLSQQAGAIRALSFDDASTIFDIINQAARAYRGAIPDDCYHEPYMPEDELHREMKNMMFFGWEEEGKLVGVMGFQRVEDVTLIRHAYVLPAYQKKGIATRLLDHLRPMTKTKRLLVGTWAAATWAIDFYQKQGFKLNPDKDELLMRYWDIPRRQVETSVVLGIEL